MRSSRPSPSSSSRRKERKRTASVAWLSARTPISPSPSSPRTSSRRSPNCWPSEFGATPVSDSVSPRSSPALGINLALTLLFLIPRLALLFAREPFFDELFTRWMGARSFAGILSALHSDSGPPLYYFIVHLLGDPPVIVLRGFSLLCACAMLALLLSARLLGHARFWPA